MTSTIEEETLLKLKEPLSDEIIRLSTLDQQAQRNYAKLLVIFKLDQRIAADDIVQHLKHGLEVALTEYPDFASTLMPVPNSDRKELELRLGADSGVPIRVLRHQGRVIDKAPNCSNLWTYGGYSELTNYHFRVADIPQELLFIPHMKPGDTPTTGLAACSIQLNIIDGGLIVGFCWHHSVCDAHSVNTLLKSWAHHTKASITQGTVGPPEIPPEQSRERWRLDYGRKDARIDQLPEYAIDSMARAPKTNDSVHFLDYPDIATIPHTISVWYFAADKLQTLRNSLSQTISESGSWFTHSEAVSALIWKHLSLARQLGDNTAGGEESLFTTRLDYRARITPPFHDKFIGNLNEPNARARVPLQEVCSPSNSQSLATLAQVIRTATGDLDEAAVRTVIGLVDSLPAVTDLTWNYNNFPGADLGVTDMSGLDTYQLDWGGALGQPTCVRSYSRERGIVYVLPQDRNGGIEVQIQCEKESLERLKSDKAFTQYAVFRC